MSPYTRVLRSTVIAGLATATGCGQSSAPGPAVAVVQAEVVAGEDKPESRKEGRADSASVPKPEQAATPNGAFRFPDDSGGKALAQVLAPPAPPRLPMEAPARPRERRVPDLLDVSRPQSPDPGGPQPRLSLPASNGTRPTALPDRVPADLGGVFPSLPERTELATGPLTRRDGPDISKPPDLPILSPKPVADRAPLTDPTFEFTARSVISPSLPLRTDPAGFVRINLPDPFEHAATAKPRTPVVEDPNRVLGTVLPPK
jgi:hypothetical protein